MAVRPPSSFSVARRSANQLLSAATGKTRSARDNPRYAHSAAHGSEYLENSTLNVEPAQDRHAHVPSHEVQQTEQLAVHQAGVGIRLIGRRPEPRDLHFGQRQRRDVRVGEVRREVDRGKILSGAGPP